MNKKSALVIVGVVIVIASTLGYVLLKEGVSEQKPTPRIETQQSDKQTNNKPASEPTVKGKYIDYSETAVAEAEGARLLFFHAPWCPQCREIEASINEGGVPDDVTVFKIDYDTNQALRQKYGVTLQTTFVKVDADGNKLESYVAYEEPNFSSVKRELLP